MNDKSPFRILIEKVSAETEVYKIKLPVSEKSLSPALSTDAVKLHYELYGRYVERSLKGEGKFQTAGAKLHTLFFEQFQIYTTSNKPIGDIEYLIEEHFGNFNDFKDQFTEEALKLEGSGWVYLNKNGSIKTISNHKDVSDDVAVIIDMWEHSYILDYGTDKEKYLKNIWRIINWDVINRRIDHV